MLYPILIDPLTNVVVVAEVTGSGVVHEREDEPMRVPVGLGLGLVGKAEHVVPKSKFVSRRVCTNSCVLGT